MSAITDPALDKYMLSLLPKMKKQAEESDME
jgi:hypothetical protein